MPAFQLVQCDAVEPDAGALDLLHSAKNRLDSFGRRVTPKHQRLEAGAASAIRAGELVHIDTVPDRSHLG
jgi:hypothetical protein